ncbi:MAG TPA: dipeptide ABC transporter permease DppC [Pantoea sp.]|nr:dipeptide ABC transporter permease DppC [Pantoea sp.]
MKNWRREAVLKSLPLTTENRVRTPWSEFWRRFRRQPVAMTAGLFVLLLIVLAFIAPLIAPFDAENYFDYDRLNQGPSLMHWFGVDALGRDIFSRVLVGTRISLIAGFFSVAIGAAIGTFFGLLAGYLGGVVDAIIMRIVDIMLALPSLLLALVLVAIFGPSIVNASIALTFVALPHYIRLTRAAVLVEVNRDYVTASGVAGAGMLRQMFVNILPNCLAPLIVQASLGFSNAILDMAALGFLGMGAQPPTPEWGTMLSDVLQYAQSAWWVVTFPGLTILLTVLAFNLMGDGLRDALDPKLKQ